MVDRRRRQERGERLPVEGLRTFLRLALGSVLLVQGLRAALRLDFPFPSLARLGERIGDSSPLALYATFLGFSPLYAAVTGGLSALSGGLLWFRRTATLGALLGAGVIVNALALCLSYGVPQKLLHLHLLLMAAFVLAPDARRLADGLLLGRATAPPPLLPRQPARPGPVLRALALAALAGLAAVVALPAWQAAHRTSAARPPLYGTYEVEELRRDGRVVPPSAGDAARWRQLTVESPTALTVRFLDGTRRSFRTTYGPHQVVLTGQAPPGAPEHAMGILAWSRPAPGILLLEGTFAGEPLAMTLRRIDDRYLLVSRGFHLILDDPVNR